VKNSAFLVHRRFADLAEVSIDRRDDAGTAHCTLDAIFDRELRLLDFLQFDSQSSPFFDFFPFVLLHSL
jgi:hypothetical protein